MSPKMSSLISLDFEAVGGIPGVHSLISVGLVAFSMPEGREIGHFYRKLLEVPGYTQDPDTMEWWKEYPAAWRECLMDAEDPAVVIPEMFDWITSFPPKIEFCANPAGFEAGQLFHYLGKFGGPKVIRWLSREQRFRMIDIRSTLAEVLNVDYTGAQRALIPQAWTENLAITHTAIDDARQQGHVLINAWRQRARNFEDLRALHQAN